MRTLSGAFSIFARVIGIPHSPHGLIWGILIFASSWVLSGQSHPSWVCNVACRGRGKLSCIPALVHHAGLSSSLKAA